LSESFECNGNLPYISNFPILPPSVRRGREKFNEFSYARALGRALHETRTCISIPISTELNGFSTKHDRLSRRNKYTFGNLLCNNFSLGRIVSDKIGYCLINVFEILRIQTFDLRQDSDLVRSYLEILKALRVICTSSLVEIHLNLLRKIDSAYRYAASSIKWWKPKLQ
jgi:hypothetical protein